MASSTSSALRPLLIALLLSLASLVALAPGAQAGLFNPNGPVKVVDHRNFDKEIIEIEKPALVAFTAPWCGHCQRLVPEYEKAAKSLEGLVKISAIDCDADENKPVCGKYGIQGFPTVKLFPATKRRLPKDYQGPRTAKAIAEYALDNIPSFVKKVKAADVDEWLDKSPNLSHVLLFTTKPTASGLYKALSLDFRLDMSFGLVRGDKEPEVMERFGVKGEAMPILFVIEPGEGAPEKRAKRYKGGLKYQPLADFLKPFASKAKASRVKDEL